jgi:thymidylate synthase
MRFRNVDQALPILLREVLAGDEVASRGGQRTREALYQHIELTEPWQREITLPERAASLPAQIAETMWVLAGRNDVEWLSNYLPRAAEFSDDGETWRAGYGPRIRSWDQRSTPTGFHPGPVDQLDKVVELLREDRTTRRAVISIWDPIIDTQPGKDIPCNNWLHFLSRDGYLHLHVATRSNDLMWGWSGINAFEWSALQEIVAGILGLKMGSIHYSISSLHLYERHYAKANFLAGQWIDRARPEPKRSPWFVMPPRTTLDALINEWFEVEEMIRTGGDFHRSLVDFPEPMMRSWLAVLAWWWTRDDTYLNGGLAGTRLEVAARLSPPNRRVTVPEAEKAAEQLVELKCSPISPFMKYVTELHNEKHAAYGDSWKRRGEMLGIMANIARKVDRLGVDGAGDTAVDTAVDLMVYLAKYRVWLRDVKQSDSTEATNHLLIELDRLITPTKPYQDDAQLTKWLVEDFAILEKRVMDADPRRTDWVDSMLNSAHRLAKTLWQAERDSITDQYQGADHE